MLGVSEVALDPAELRIGATDALEIGRYRFAVRQDGREPRIEGGTYLVLHRRGHDGIWRRHVDVFSPDGGPGRS